MLGFGGFVFGVFEEEFGGFVGWSGGVEEEIYEMVLVLRVRLFFFGFMG